MRLRFSLQFCAAIILVTASHGQVESPPFDAPAKTVGVRASNCDVITASGQGVSVDTLLGAFFDDRLSALLDETQSVAGLAVAVVRKDRIVYTRGFGYRDLQTCSPVNSKTRFYLKSTTKSFLGVLAAQLHEEGVIDLDAPITDYLPNLAPPGVNASLVSLRQHLTHGAPYFDGGLNYKSAFVGMDSAEYVPHINTYARATDTRFRYSNFGPIVAAHAIAKATNSNWRDLIQTKIFDPLDMSSSFTYMDKAQDGPMATAYRIGDDTPFVRTHTKAEEQMHAAGGAVSTVSDLGRWLIASLNDGVVDGEQRISARAFQQAQARQISLDRNYYNFHRFAHGFGHYSATYEDDLLVHHFGGETHVSFMPEHGIGVVVLSNQIQGGSITTHRVAALIYDQLLGKEDLDERWSRASAEIREGVQRLRDRKAERIRQLREAAPDTSATTEPSVLAGRYRDDRLGTIDLTMDGRGEGRILMQFGALSGMLEHVRGNAYLADFDPWGGPPELFVFRHHNDSGRLFLDWDGRLFEAVE